MPKLLKLFMTIEQRAAARRNRIARWDGPIVGRWGRLRAWANMIAIDHGIFRLASFNLHALGRNAFRSAQPAPYQLAALQRKGLRTVVCLRGERESGSWQLEKEACRLLGLELVELRVRSRGAPEKELLLGMREFFARLEHPVLFHCKAGADRAGLVAALYLMLHEGVSAAQALRQLSPAYGHFRFAKTGILDLVIERYRDEGEAAGLGFEEWVETRYDAESLEREFVPGRFSDFIVDHVIRRE